MLATLTAPGWVIRSKYAPCPTDQWTPCHNKFGNIMCKADGTKMWMPIPRVQNLPFYNFNNSMWEDEDTVKLLWDKFQKSFDPTDFADWGETPIYADYKGMPVGHFDDKTQEFKPQALDYPTFNLKLANDTGYFEFAPELKAKAHEKYHTRKDYKIKTEKTRQEQAAKDAAAIKQKESAKNIVQGLKVNKYE